MFGYSREQFQVYYTTSNQFTVVSAPTYTLPPPLLSKAIFDSLGSTVQVLFDRPTNKAKLADSFACDNLLQFNGADSLDCLWLDSYTVQITLSTTKLLNIGDSIQLQSLTYPISAVPQLKAYCPDSITNCNMWPSSFRFSRVFVFGPIRAVQPNVVVAGSLQISSCQKLVLDFSSSSGNVGRKWNSINVDIQTSSNVSQLHIQYLKSIILFQLNTAAIQAITVSSNVLLSNTVYSFHFEFCNYFDACGQGYWAVQVLDYFTPIVVIHSPKSVTVDASDNITLYSSVRLTSFNLIHH